MNFINTLKAIADFSITDLSNMDAVNMQVIAKQALELYEVAKAVPIPSEDLFDIIGINDDDSETILGTYPIPPQTKAQDVVKSYFGELDSEAAQYALQCCLEVIEYIVKHEHQFLD